MSSTTWKPIPKAIKRIADIIVSLWFMILLFPLFLLISLIIITTSGFPFLFSQKRVGKNFKEFNILKFRTMDCSGDPAEPKLASMDDKRITPFGRFLRKWRLDELPQFYNVLKGDMSLVGPRPEQAYFVAQLQERLPGYSYIFDVQPGLTSSGMVNFGYAANIDEMLIRAPFDIEYVEQLSLTQDLKIIAQTVLVLVQGKGI